MWVQVHVSQYCFGIAPSKLCAWHFPYLHIVRFDLFFIHCTSFSNDHTNFTNEFLTLHHAIPSQCVCACALCKWGNVCVFSVSCHNILSPHHPPPPILLHSLFILHSCQFCATLCIQNNNVCACTYSWINSLNYITNSVWVANAIMRLHLHLHWLLFCAFGELLQRNALLWYFDS